MTLGILEKVDRSFKYFTLLNYLAVIFVTDALKMDGDEVMVDIYESVQDELRMKSKQLLKERQKVVSVSSFYPPKSRIKIVCNIPLTFGLRFFSQFQANVPPFFRLKFSSPLGFFSLGEIFH